MSVDKQAVWSFTEALPIEDQATLGARERARELGVSAVPASVATLLQLLARARGARTAVEVGTGVGISTVAILRGMDPSGVLTTIDKDLDHLKAAREALQDAQIPNNRVRPITGKAADVLPRLSKSAYDLVFLDADKASYPEYVEHALRLLRPGGLLIINDALNGDKVAQPTSREPETQVMRAITKSLTADESVTMSIVPVGNGVLIAAKEA